MRRVSAPLLVGFVSLLGWLNPSGSYVYAQYYDCSLTCNASGPSTGLAGVQLQFTATAVAYYCTGTPTYAWDFGNGRKSTEESPTNTYQSPGTYSWSVTVTVQETSASQNGTITINSRPVTTVSAASFDASGLASDSIAAGFGSGRRRVPRRPPRFRFPRRWLGPVLRSRTSRALNAWLLSFSSLRDK